jgi:phosphate transport system substrate-binding protein
MMLTSFALSLLCCQPVLDSDVPDYRPAGSLKGALTFGPDGGFEKLLASWSQRMKSYYPDVRGLEAPRGPAQTTPQALLLGTARCGMSWKPWSVREIDAFRETTGSLPVELVVGADAVVVVVHPDNPVRGLKLDELDGIFSSTLNRSDHAIHTWGEFKLGNPWKGKPLHAFGVASASTPASPAREVFVERVLQAGKFSDDVKMLASPAAVLQAVAEDPLAVGFVPFSAGAKGARAVPILASEGALIELSGENILNLTYPLAWRIRITYRHDREVSLDSIQREFFAFILSRDGQTIVAEEGYVPISGPLARKQTKLVK